MEVTKDIQVKKAASMENGKAISTTKLPKKAANIESTVPQSEPSEIRKDLPIAEDIASFRADMEEKIFFKGIPSREWQKVYDQTLALYPRIQGYKAIFDEVLSVALHRNDQINNFWEQHAVSETEAMAIDDPTAANPLAVQADEVSSKNMFKALFNFVPQGEVEATKGSITLRFVINENDYRRMEAPGKAEEVISGASMHYIPGIEFPVLVIRRDAAFIVSGELSEGLMHELEHAKNYIMDLGRDALWDYWDTESGKLSRGFKEVPFRDALLRRKFQNRAVPDSLLKNEMLAYFTPFEYLDRSQLTSDSLPQIVRAYSGYIKLVLLDEQGLYYLKFKQSLLSEEQILRHKQLVEKGVDSLVELFQLYEQSGSPRNPARMAINVLEQFPLQSWPAVTRLLKSRYSKRP